MVEAISFFTSFPIRATAEPGLSFPDNASGHMNPA
jgi:hypothetical protein